MSNIGKLIPALLLILSAGLAKAELLVESGYVRASLPGAASTSAYMKLSNTGDTDLVIANATTPVAGKVTIHSTMNHDGMLHMMEMENLKIAAHKSVTLEPGGMHLMLENTSALLAAGGKIELVLQLADGQKKTLSLPVKSVLEDKH